MAAVNRRRVPPRTLLERLIREQDRTHEEVARWFQQVAQGLGEHATLTARHLRRLASGERPGTNPGTRRVLQAMFGHPARALLSGDPDESTDDRFPVVQSSGRSDKEIVRMAAQRARRFTIGASTSNLTGEAMDQLHDDVATLAVSYQQKPLSELLAALVETQDVLFELLEGRQPPAYTRRLLLLAGVVSGLLAKASHDLADPHTAITQSRAAFLCADNADHNGLRAWIRGLQSLIAYWGGRPHDAVSYARRGSEYAGRGTTSAWLPVSEARAWAALGNGQAARAAIEAAESARERVQPDEVDELGGLCTFSHARQLYYSADALTWLPDDAAAAERYALAAEAAYADITAPGWAFADAAGTATSLATARIWRAEFDGAAAAMEPVLAMAPGQRIHGVVVSVQRVQRALPSVVDVGVQSDLRERLEAFTATPARAVLGR